MQWRNYSYSTEKHDCRWIKRFIRFHHLNHPDNLKEKEKNRFNILKHSLNLFIPPHIKG
ncbi:MAG: phage integrase N-terminal SAM-like domain-containing protein [Balneolaceae bacterium]